MGLGTKVLHLGYSLGEHWARHIWQPVGAAALSTGLLLAPNIKVMH